MAGRRNVAVLTLMAIGSWSASVSECQAGPLFDRLFKRNQNNAAAAAYPPSQATAGYPPGASCGPGFCQQTVVQYVPQIAYQTAYQPVPVTTYRTTTSINPANGLPMTCTRPCTTYTYQARRVPYTSYRPVYTTVPVTDPAAATGYGATTAGYGAVPGYGPSFTPDATGYSPAAAAPYGYGYTSGYGGGGYGGYAPYSGGNPYRSYYGYQPGAAYPVTPVSAYAVSPSSCSSCNAAWQAPSVPGVAAPAPGMPAPFGASPYANPYGVAPSVPPYTPWQTPPAGAAPGVPGATEWQPVSPGSTSAPPSGLEPADVNPSLRGTPPNLRVPLPDANGYGSSAYGTRYGGSEQAPAAPAGSGGSYSATPWQPVAPSGASGRDLDGRAGGGEGASGANSPTYLRPVLPRGTPPELDAPQSNSATSDSSARGDFGGTGGYRLGADGWPFQDRSRNNRLATPARPDEANPYGSTLDEGPTSGTPFNGGRRPREADYNSRAVRDLDRERSPWEYDEERVPELLNPRDKTASSPTARTRHAAVPIQWPPAGDDRGGEIKSGSSRLVPIQRAVRQPRAGGDLLPPTSRPPHISQRPHRNSDWLPAN